MRSQDKLHVFGAYFDVAAWMIVDEGYGFDVHSGHCGEDGVRIEGATMNVSVGDATNTV